MKIMQENTEVVHMLNGVFKKVNNHGIKHLSQKQVQFQITLAECDFDKRTRYIMFTTFFKLRSGNLNHMTENNIVTVV